VHGRVGFCIRCHSDVEQLKSLVETDGGFAASSQEEIQADAEAGSTPTGALGGKPPWVLRCSLHFCLVSRVRTR
jgi:hypothetical protein